MLKKTFGPKRDKVAVKWRGPHKDELRNLYSSPNIIQMTESRKMRCALNVERQERCVQNFGGEI